MTIPHRGRTSESTYFVTTSTWEKKNILQSERMAELLINVLHHYRAQQKYLLHEFVVMPNHFHLLISPIKETTLERAMQLIKGGFSFRPRRSWESKARFGRPVFLIGAFVLRLSIRNIRSTSGKIRWLPA